MEQINHRAVINRMKQFITGEDIARLLGQEGADNTMKYSELVNYKTIYELLPEDRTFKIILIEEKKNNGHFIAILRYKDTIEYFDSYGVCIDGELRFINAVMKRMLGETRHYLTELLHKVKDMKVIVNKHKFQKLDPNIGTCGRWCILRIIMMKDMFYNLEEFTEFIEQNEDDLDLSPDALVSVWVR